MRKIRKGLLIGLSCSLLVLGLSACKEGDSGSNYTYDWTYVEEFVDECDADMKIDGVLDEERWQNLNWLYHGEDNVKLSYTTAFTEKGMYIAAKAEDEKMQWNARYNFSHFRGNGALNSSFWFQIAGPEVEDGHAMRNFNFFVDAYNRASRNQTRFAAETTTNGDVKTGTATEMITEMFVSWDALNIELGENGELPEFVYFTPSYRYVVENDASSIENKWISPTGTYPKNLMWWNYDKGYAGTLADFNWYRAKTGVHFNKDGYVNYDAEGATLGMSANGICKSDGWDVSKLVSDGEVTCVAPYEQYIFAKDVYAEKFYFKADLVFNPYTDGNAKYEREWPSMGLAVVQSTTNSRCFYISGDTVLDGKMTNGLWQTFSNSIELQNWTKSSFGAVTAPAGKDVPTEGWTLEVIKDGSVIYYFVEGQFVGSDDIPELSGKACPALFSIGGRGTYKNIEVETDASVIDAKLSQAVRTVSTEVSGSGTVELERSALKIVDGVAAQDIVVTIIPDTNYVISNIVLEGLDSQITDSWTFFLENYENGVLTIPNEYIKDNVTIKVNFTRLRSVLNENQVIELTGTLKSEDGKTLVGSNLVVYDENCKPLYYSVITSSTGKYSLFLPKAGTYTFEGRDLEMTGVYKARVLGTGGYKSTTYEIDLTEVEGAKLEQDFVLEFLEFRPTQLASELYSSQVEYTLDGNYKLKGAYYFEGESVAQAEDFVLYATVDQTISEDISSEMGFVVGTGDGKNGHYLFFALKKVNDGFTAFIWSEGSKDGSKAVAYNASTISFSGENKWMNVCPYGADGDLPLEMALVYKNGEYTLYLNGCLAYTVTETELMKEGYPQDTYKNVIGTEGDKKLGLLSLNKSTAFTDWGFSTDGEVIQSYIDAEDRPVEVPVVDIEPTPSMTKPNLPIWIYGGGATAGVGSDGNLSLKGAYVFDGNGILNGTPFVVEATFTISTASEIGFVVTSDKNQSLKPMFVYKKDNTFMFYTSDWKKDVEGIANNGKQYSVGDTVTMTLVYKGGMYYIFMDGELACSVSATAKATYGDIKVCETIGFEKMLYLGLASLNGEPTTYTDWWYDTNTEVVDGYLEGLDISDTPTPPDDSETSNYSQYAEVKDFVTDVSNEYSSSMNDPSDNNPHFEVTATFGANASESQIGFEFTTNEGRILRFVYLSNFDTTHEALGLVDGPRMGFYSEYGDEIYYRWYSLNTAIDLSQSNTIKVTYNGNRLFRVYVNGVELIATNGRSDSQFNLGWGLNGNDSSGHSDLPLSLSGYGTLDNRKTLYVRACASNEATQITDFTCVVTGGYGYQGEPVNPGQSDYIDIANFACNIEPEGDGQFNNNAEASNINPHFEVTATFSGGDSSGLVGFAFTAEDGKVLRVAYNKVTKRIGFYDGISGWDNYREYTLKEEVFNVEGENTLKIIYTGNRMMEVYLNGTKMEATNGRQGYQFYMGWNCVDTNKNSSMTQMKPYQMWGTSTIDNRGTLKVCAYASDEATVITNFTCTVIGGYGYQN